MLNDFDDIPVAVREEQSTLHRPGKSRRWVMVGGGLAAATGLCLGGAVAFLNASPPLDSLGAGQIAEQLAEIWAAHNPLNGDRPNTAGQSAAQEGFVTADQAQSEQGQGNRPGAGDSENRGGNNNRLNNALGDTAGSNEAIAANTASGETTAPTTAPQSAAILGHYPYAEAAATDLVPLGDNSGVLLAPAAAQAFRSMQQAAQREGIRLISLSGFRSVETQRELFFGVKAARGQTASERAKVSAPPGHSEHHTGYAIDIGDANNRAMDLSEGFETTAAFRWLQTNAPYYSFELSFPRNNNQGVSYEPWHWRYVGDQASLELFHKGR